MEKNINLAKILNGKPVNTKLWSPLFGDVYTSSTCREDTIIVVNHHGESSSFYNNGKYFNHTEAEPLLFPSKEMRDWSKFSWKKGDVLQNNDHNIQVIFDRFTSDTYEMISCKYWLKVDNGNEKFVIETNEFTKNFFKISEELSQCYINEIENRLGGKLNLETLEIEKQTKFKDGDIVCISGMGYLAYGIVKNIDNSSKKLEYYVLNDMSTLKFEDWLSFEDKQIYPITETQQIILFDALAKENKAWDAEKKQIVDLNPKWTPKPFDKVITRVDGNAIWTANIFSHIDQHGEYVTISCVGGYPYCIPYNEETAKLIGTTDDWEGSKQ